MGLYDTIQVSLMVNPMLWNEPYLPELCRIAERAAAREWDQALRTPLQQLAAVLRLPLPERTFRLVSRNFDLQKPLIEAKYASNVTNVFANSPDIATFDLLVNHFLEPMDRAARAESHWAQLAGSYLELTYLAQRRDRPNLVNLAAQRMVDILKEHRSYGDENNSASGVTAPQVAKRLIELGRTADLDELVTSSSGVDRFNFVMHKIGQQVSRDMIDEARIIALNELAPVAPGIADRLLQSMNGQVVPLPPQPKQPEIIGSRRIARETDPQELSLRYMLTAMADHYARTGNLELAAKQLIALRQDEISPFPSRYELSRDTWWQLGEEARNAGNTEASRIAFSRMQEMYEKEQARSNSGPLSLDPALVREAISLNDGVLLRNVHASNSINGPLVLGRAWFDRGNIPRARALIEQSAATAAKCIAAKYQVVEELPKIAVEFNRIGDRDRAVEVLQEAVQFINADVFVIGYASEVISLAVRFNRFDLIEQSYTRSTDPGRRLVIGLAATHVARLMKAGILPEDGINLY